MVPYNTCITYLIQYLNLANCMELGSDGLCLRWFADLDLQPKGPFLTVGLSPGISAVSAQLHIMLVFDLNSVHACSLTVN